jgi:uncharacterized membrane protein YgdD (TMEM256/DUF423 family)
LKERGATIFASSVNLLFLPQPAASEKNLLGKKSLKIFMSSQIQSRLLKMKGHSEGTSDQPRIIFMTETTATRIAAAAGFLAVALGAFGAHGLKEMLVQNGTTAIWEQAAFYHFIHAVMLFVVAGRKPFPAGAWWSFLAGIVIFSGSLYLLAVTDAKWLGAITPIGGLSFLTGWAWLFFLAGKIRIKNNGGPART